MKYLSVFFFFSFMLLNLYTINAQTSASFTQEKRARLIQGQDVQKAFGIIDTIEYSKINPKRMDRVPSSSKGITGEQASAWGRQLPNETSKKTPSQKERSSKQKAKGVREAFGIDY